MFSRESETSSSVPKWPIIIAVVVLFLVAIQMLRVNRPQPSTSETPEQQVPAYTQAGPIVVGEIVIPAGSFHSRKLNLNRRWRLVGTFQTGNVKRRVSVLVLREKEIDLWSSNSVYTPLAETGYVPGGKVSPVLEPGSYFLVIDNRFNQEAMSVDVNFNLE